MSVVEIECTGKRTSKMAGFTQGVICNSSSVQSIQDTDIVQHTDIGQMDSNGYLVIIGRKKAIFKLSQGEYIRHVNSPNHLYVGADIFPSPDRLEGVFLKSKFVEQVFVHGDSLRSYVVCQHDRGDDLMG